MSKINILLIKDALQNAKDASRYDLEDRFNFALLDAKKAGIESFSYLNGIENSFFKKEISLNSKSNSSKISSYYDLIKSLNNPDEINLFQEEIPISKELKRKLFTTMQKTKILDKIEKFGQNYIANSYFYSLYYYSLLRENPLILNEFKNSQNKYLYTYFS